MARLSALRGPLTDRIDPATRNILLLLAGSPPPSRESFAAAVSGPPFERRVGSPWEVSLLPAARAHGLLPLVAERLAALPAAVLPPGFRERVLLERRAAAARSLHRVAALHEARDALAARGIDALSFKGPALAARLHGDPALRDGEDLDLLVEPSDLAGARGALESAGYRMAFPLPASSLAAYRDAGCELPFVRGDGAVVDLHWRLVPPFFRFPLEREGLRAAARDLPVGGRPVRVPGDAHHLLLVAFHGGKSLWARLGWVVDLARFLSLPDGPPVEEVRRLARATGSERTLATGVLLAGILPGFRPPPGLEDAGRDGEAARLAARFRARLIGGAAGGGWRERFELLLRLRERRRDRWSLLAGLAGTPAPADWGRIARFPLLRPALGGARTVRALARHGRRLAGGAA